MKNQAKYKKDKFPFAKVLADLPFFVAFLGLLLMAWALL